ncbi:MAG: 2-isopropylmalate synthase [Candidatus Anammoxibacter sp.]
MDKIIIFDTTLRDGEQSPGASLDINEKVQIAHQLKLLNVDVIEAGFPISSIGDFEAVKTIANEIKGTTIAALARAVDKDIKRAAEALKNAEKPRIHIFLATSAIHRKFKLGKAKEEIITMAVKAVKFAKKYTNDIEFSPEDASRTEPDFLAKVVEAVIDAGATTVNIPDTVGFAVPEEYAELITGLKNNVGNISNAIISVHCHNDMGLAVANSLSAIKAGAQQVECTVNGIGERAGNTAIEEIVMALKTKKDYYKIESNINTKEIIATSKLVSSLTGLRVQRNKAIVGENAFAHESGVHQDGILKERSTYEVMNPKDIGLLKTKLVLGKLSGRHAFKERIKELGYELTKAELDHAFTRFKLLTDKKKNIYDEDLEALVQDEKAETPHIFTLEDLNISCGPIPTAGVKIRIGKNETIERADTGDGPIDALYNAIDLSTGISAKLVDYNIRAVSRGKDAMGEVNIELEIDGQLIRGRAVSTDIIEGSGKAYLNAINKVASKLKKKKKGCKIKV